MLRGDSHKRFIYIALCAVATGAGLCANAQMSPSNPSFEVATVKPVLRDSAHPFNPNHFGPHLNPAGASYWSMTVTYLIGYAYGIESYQIKGPDWAAHDFFDVEARYPAATSKEDAMAMMQALLKERFQLAFHIEKRELESYALVVGKGGEKLTPASPDPAVPKIALPLQRGTGVGPEDSRKVADKQKFGTQTVRFDEETSSMHFEQSKMTMADLAQRLSVCVDSSYHKVVDETGLKGTYQVAYDCPLSRPAPRAGSNDGDLLPPDPQGSYVLTRSLGALGLKLEKRMVLQDVYVIDHVKRPSAN